MVNDSAESWVTSSYHIEGISLSNGVGLGRAVIHQPRSQKTPFYQGSFGVDSQHELFQLYQAFDRLIEEIQTMGSSPLSSQSKRETLELFHNESRDVLNVYLMLANDPGWKRQLAEKINKGVTALDSIDQTLKSIRNNLKKTGEQSLWQERIIDFEDLSSRLKSYLSSPVQRTNMENDGYAIIVIADRIGPAELLDYDRELLMGLVLVEQSQTSHVAIVARSLEIPVVGGIKNGMSEIKAGDTILVDGNEGRIYIRPEADVIQRFDSQSLLKKPRSYPPQLKAIVPLSAQTLDGVSIKLFLNAGLVEDVEHIQAAGAEGVGLYRTEILFMMRPKLPNVVEQTKLYREIIQRAGNYPVVFRTLDVGGDKVLPYLERLESGRQKKGSKDARIFFDLPVLLRYQLRALIRASEGGELTIMLPMIAEVAEIKAAREVLDEEVERERAKGNLVPAKIRLGAMIEVPSLIYQLPQLFPHVDFLSVGSNDLFQFFYAIDREYPKLSDRYDVLSPTFLSLLKSIQDQCSMAKVPLSVCGEMAGRPLEALALIGLGYHTLSMSAVAVPLVKKMIRSLTYQQISDYMREVCVPSQSTIRQSLRHFARDHNIYIE